MNGLDTQGMEDVRELLQKQKETGVTVILASHSMEDIRLLCDTVHRIQDASLIPCTTEFSWWYLNARWLCFLTKSTAILRLDPVTVIGTMRGTQWGRNPQMHGGYSTQFSTTKPCTRSNSRTLFVTRIISSDLACAAISISNGPIGVPLFCR